MLSAGLIGCSGSSSTPSTPVTPTQTERAVNPLTAPVLAMSTDVSGTVHALKSVELARIADFLVNKRPVSSTVTPLVPTKSSGIAGIIVEILIAGIETGIHSSEISDVKKEIGNLQDSVNEIKNDIDSLNTTMGIKFDSTYYGITDNQNQTALQNTKTDISSAFFGSTSSSLSYYNDQTLLIKQCTETSGFPDTCTPAQKNAYTNSTNLENDKIQFVKNLDSIKKDVANINGFITGDVKLLNTSVKNILSQVEAKNISIDSNSAMNVYLMLEDVFAQLLAYQFQGAIIIANDSVYNKPTSYFDTNNYLTGDFEHYVRQECFEFLKQVQFLAVNLNDYRNKDTYSTSMKSVAQGLATDPVFSNVLSRARFFSAQVLQKFTVNRDNGGFTDTNGVTYPPNTTYYNGNGNYHDELYRFEFGLHGAIVVPCNYTFDQTTQSSKPIKLELYDSNNNKVATTSAQIDPAQDAFSRKVNGRFPNTAWQANAKGVMTALEDYQWVYYDFDFSHTNLTAGTYTVKFVEEGKNILGSTGPWPHNTTTIGTVQVQYWDPTSDNPVGQDKSSSTNTTPFGFFSYYWPWGTQLFSASPASFWTNLTSIASYSSTFLNYLDVSNNFSNNSWDKTYTLSFNLGSLDTGSAKTSDVAFMYNSSTNNMSATCACLHSKMDSLSYQYSISDGGKTSIVIDSGSGTSKRDNTVGSSKITSTNKSVYKTETLNHGDYSFSLYQGFSSSLEWPYYGCEGVTLTSDLNWSMQLLFPSAAKNIMDID